MATKAENFQEGWVLVMSWPTPDVDADAELRATHPTNEDLAWLLDIIGEKGAAAVTESPLEEHFQTCADCYDRLQLALSILYEQETGNLPRFPEATP